MTVKLIAENILAAADFLSATEQEGEYFDQPTPNSANTGKFRLLSDGTPADFSYSGTATGNGAAAGTSILDTHLAIFGDDFLIEATVTMDDIAQDTGDYTEVDVVANRVVKTDATTLTVTTLDNDEEVYVYKDMGANFFFGNFEFTLKTSCTECSVSALCAVWAVAGTVDDLLGIDTASGNYIAVYWSNNGVAGRIWLEECAAGAVYSDVFSGSLSTNYYIKITRDTAVGANGTAYCYIYSDSAMTTLVDTLTLALHSDFDYRYLYWMNTKNIGVGGVAVSAVIEDLTIVWPIAIATVDDSLQSTGWIQIDSAFSYQVQTGMTFTLTMSYSTRDFAIELVGSGDTGNALFKWSHDGGTTYFGRDAPDQATWIAGSHATLANPGLNHKIPIIEIDSGLALFYGKTTDNKIYKIVSTDGGLTWAAGTAVITGAAAITPYCATKLKSGRIILAYWEGNLYLRYSDDDGDTWSDAVDFIDNDLNDMIELYNGNVLAAFAISNVIYVKISTDGGATWGSTVTVSGQGTNMVEPTLIQTDNGNILCAYASDEDDAATQYSIKSRLSSDNGATWPVGDEGTIFNYVANAYRMPDLEKDINGDIYCVADKAGTGIMLSKSSNHGASWGAEVDMVITQDGDPCLRMVHGHIMMMSQLDAGNNRVEIWRRGFWTSYSANGCPCATEATAQHLICGAEIVWHGGAGILGDIWTFDAAYDYAMANLIEDSPQCCWRSEQDNIACNIVLDLGANERFYADGVSFFGCNVRTFSFQMNATDSWGSPSVDESVSFDITTAGVIDSVSGNGIEDAALMASYKDHELKGRYFRATNGTDSGVTWKIKDNIGNYIILDTTASHNLAASNTFAIYQSNIAATFTAGIYRYMRIAISAQQTKEDYYQIGSMVVGRTISLTKGFAPGYDRNHVYNIEMIRTQGGGMIPIKSGDRKRIFNLTWYHNETTREEVIALLDYLDGKNICFIPDSATLTDCILVKLIGDAAQHQTYKDRFDLGPIVLEEVL